MNPQGIQPQPGYSHTASVASLVGAGHRASGNGEMEFCAMVASFQSTGGILAADDLASRMRETSGGGVGTVARWIVSRRVVNIHWKGVYWLPRFQFTQPGLLLRSSMAIVINELAPVVDDWDMAFWFSCPNEWLADATPANALLSRPHDVFNAARAHRFVAAG